MARSGSAEKNGICINSRKFGVSRNMGITTTKSNSKIRLPLNIALTFIDGIGHGFGAVHDFTKNDFCGSNVANTFLMHEFPNPNSPYKKSFLTVASRPCLQCYIEEVSNFVKIA